MEGGLRGLVHGASSAGKSALGRVFGSYLLRHVTEVLGVDEPQRVCQVRKEVTWDGGLRGPPPPAQRRLQGRPGGAAGEMQELLQARGGGPPTHSGIPAGPSCLPAHPMPSAL